MFRRPVPIPAVVAWLCDRRRRLTNDGVKLRTVAELFVDLFDLRAHTTAHQERVTPRDQLVTGQHLERGRLSCGQGRVLSGRREMSAYVKNRLG